MVDHEVHGNQRLDPLGVLAHLLGNVAHCGQVSQQWHAGKVLQHDTRKHERDFIGPGGIGLPAGNLADVCCGDFLAVAIAQHGFENDAD